MVTNEPNANPTTLRAWTVQLYREYDHILYTYNLKLRQPVIRIHPLAGRWGEWHGLTRTITIHPELIHRYPWHVVIEILKHEMAHQLAWENLGDDRPHGPRFSTACDLLAVADWARSPSGELPATIPDWHCCTHNEKEARLLRKVEKLLALATSSNEHEALLAMQKVRELYAKYNLTQIQTGETSAYVYSVLGKKKKRIETAESMIFSILAEHFFVQVIYGHLYDAKELSEFSIVEVLGRRENVLMAEYVYEFLQKELAYLAKEYQRRNGKLKGSKRSYILGLLSGFSEKLHQAKLRDSTVGLDNDQPRALIALADEQLKRFVHSRYPKLRNRFWGNTHADRAAFNDGVSDGKSITLHRPLSHHQGNRGFLLNR
ncbi:MAG: DUF2786 domain-containing protein [Deltaproteobacteria bacterium]|nr:DUF2786 domain-containing protein [Deltaproteobacteria bacterium]